MIAAPPPVSAPARRIVLVTGLSGAGKGSILRVLEDLGYEAVDNPPLPLMEDVIARGERPMAIGVDARSRGFEAGDVLAMLARLKRNPALRPELVFAFADEASLLRRFTETRRRHPLAPDRRIADGVAAEIASTGALREAADLAIDTSGLPLPSLRRMIERWFGSCGAVMPGMTVTLISFAYPAGLPREAELVFDARFLRNPHYEPMLREQTGIDPAVARFIAADPDFSPFVGKVTDLLNMLLPRFVLEGKKYASIAVGCTGGRHRSVFTVETLARRLKDASCPGGGQTFGRNEGAPAEHAPPWRIVVTHRELRDLAHPETEAARA